MTKSIYERGTSLSQVVELLTNNEGVHLLAGGTDLMVGIREHKVKPQLVVDIKDIPECKVLKEDDQGITIGAAISVNEIVRFKPVRDNVPVLADGCHSIGSYSIRNRATLVGNICNGSPAGDTYPALYVLGAKVNIVGPEGEKVVPIEEFILGPRRVALKKGEFVVSVLIPKPYAKGKGMYKKASRTDSVDLTTVGVAVQWDGPQVKVAIGAVGATPLRAKSVEAAVNQGDRNWENVAKLALNDISPISDIRSSKEFRMHLAEIHVRRCLEQTMEV